MTTPLYNVGRVPRLAVCAACPRSGGSETCSASGRAIVAHAAGLACPLGILEGGTAAVAVVAGSIGRGTKARAS